MLYLAVIADEIEQLVDEGDSPVSGDDLVAVFTLLSQMTTGAKRRGDERP